MGQSKPLLLWREGTLLGNVVRGLSRLPLERIVVVTGAERERVEAALAAEANLSGVPVRAAFNAHYATTEMAGSLQVGLRALDPLPEAILVCLADQPEIPAEIITALLHRWHCTRAPVVAPVYRGQRGNPVLLDRAVFSALLALPPTANPRDAIRAAHTELVEVTSASVARDMDTPEAYKAAQEPVNGKP
jgi:molybdenum cofactor cytidylyltransferase